MIDPHGFRAAHKRAAWWRGAGSALATRSGVRRVRHSRLTERYPLTELDMPSLFVRVVTALAAVVALGGPAPLAAQGTGTVRGRVTDAATQRPIGDATVNVVGTSVGAVTGANGEFVIQRAPAGAQRLAVRRLGFRPATVDVQVQAGGEVTANVTLTESVSQLDRVVVTGTGQPAAQRTLGNAVSQISASELTDRSSINNVAELLQNKAPSVAISPGGGATGAAADIRIRGTSSLSSSNRPIVFIDGIRFNDGNTGAFQASGAGTGNAFSQGNSALDAVDPEDIESIEVIKGPAAATLYGADAAGGVIQIITKRGARGQQNVRWTFRAEYGQNAIGLPLDKWTNYTRCTPSRVNPTTVGDSLFIGCRDQAPGSVISSNVLATDPAAFRSGDFGSFNLSARGGGDRYSFYFSGDRTTDQGVYFNNFQNRTSLRGNFTYQLTDRLEATLNSSYIRTDLRQALEGDGALGIVISGVRGVPGRPTNLRTGRAGWAFQVPETSNQYDNQNHIDRTIVGTTLNYRPFNWFRNRLTTGLDLTAPFAQVYANPATTFALQDASTSAGLIAQRNDQTRLFTFDYVGTIANTLPRSLQSELSFGVQGVKSQFQRTQATGSGLPGPEFRLVGQAVTVAGASSFSEQASLGFYAQEQVGFANRLFVTAAVRADDNSAFGRDFDRVLYPKFSVSYVASDEPGLSDVFETIRMSDVRFRYAYGRAGRAPGPYDAQRTFGAVRGVNAADQATSGIVPGSPGNFNLTAELGTEHEGGFDASFLGERIQFNATYYSKTTTDALLALATAPSTGFSGVQWRNFGTIKNAGAELVLRVRPIARPNFSWDAQVNYATNENKMVTLAGGVTQLEIFNPYIGAASAPQIIRAGYPVAGFWSVDVCRDATGAPMRATAGCVAAAAPAGLVLDANSRRFVGPSTPTYMGGFSNTVTFLKNFRAYALVDFQGGHYILNAKDRQRAISGLTRPAMDLTGVDSLYHISGIPTAPWIQPADFVKLRDVSLSYTLPDRVARLLRVSGAQWTVAGHNLAMLSSRYDGIDPEVNFIGGATFETARTNFINLLRTDSYQLPMIRRLSTSVTLTF